MKLSRRLLVAFFVAVFGVAGSPEQESLISEKTRKEEDGHA